MSGLYLPRLARDLGALVRRVARRFSWLSGFCRLALLRVDLRDGSFFESSRAKAAFFAAALERFRAAEEPAPAFLSEALTPGFEVSGPAAFFFFLLGALGWGRVVSRLYFRAFLSMACAQLSLVPWSCELHDSNNFLAFGRGPWRALCLDSRHP